MEDIRTRLSTYRDADCVPACAGHLGKFDSCLVEAVWTLATDSADESTGTVEYRGWYALLILDAEETVTLADDTVVTVPAGAYVISEDSQGFVMLVKYGADTATAREDYTTEDSLYGQWLDADEVESAVD